MDNHVYRRRWQAYHHQRPASQTLAANNKIAFVDIYAAVAIPVLVDQQPQPVTALENRPLTLSVTTSNAYALDTPFSGSGPLSYQWYLNDNPVAAGTNQTYTVP